MVYNTTELIDRAYSELDKLNDVGTKSLTGESNKSAKQAYKLSIPSPIIILENRKTYLANFRDLCIAMDQEEEIVKTFFDEEFNETSSVNENGSLVISRTIPAAKAGIKKILNNYISKYIVCSECKSINTNICKENKITYLNCKNCLSKKAIDKS